MTSKALSVVVAPTSGGGSLPGCLDALAAQRDAPPFEIIVPVDGSIAGVAELRVRSPAVRVIEVVGTEELARSSDIGVVHVAIDRRRAAGLAAAEAPVVALTDEHARPASDWCRRLVDAHREPHAVIGGAIGNAVDRPLNWALFFGDSGRYQNPLPAGPAEFVSDVNVSYKKSALDAVAPVWRDLYHETGLHDALRERGETLWLRPDLVVDQDRGSIELAYAVRERFAWARLYAGRRASEVSGARRAVFAAGSPLLAPVLFLRQARLAFARGRHRAAFIRAAPLLLLMDTVRALGEMTGYISGQATPADER